MIQTINKFQLNHIGLLPFPLFGPVLWLSASNFDGAHACGGEVIIGNASGRTKDSIGNAVTSAGTIQVEDSLGHSTYHFTGEGSITSVVPVSNQYTLATVFRRSILNEKGRFFTGSEANYLFASHSKGVGQLFVEGWVTIETRASAQIEGFIVTNQNGLKNMWDIFENKQIVSNSTVGSNNWGKSIIGRPVLFPEESADVSVYEALVYQYALDSAQIDYLKTFVKKKYSISYSHPFRPRNSHNDGRLLNCIQWRMGHFGSGGGNSWTPEGYHAPAAGVRARRAPGW